MQHRAKPCWFQTLLAGLLAFKCAPSHSLKLGLHLKEEAGKKRGGKEKHTITSWSRGKGPQFTLNITCCIDRAERDACQWRCEADWVEKKEKDAAVVLPMKFSIPLMLLFHAKPLAHLKVHLSLDFTLSPFSLLAVRFVA